MNIFINKKCFLCLNTHNEIVKNVTLVEEKLKYILPEENITLWYNKIIKFKPNTFKHICVDCWNDLNHVYKFKQKCIKSLKYLCDYIEESTEQLKHQKEQRKLSDITINDTDNNTNFEDSILHAADDAQEYNEEEKVVIKIESENISDNSDEATHTNNLEDTDNTTYLEDSSLDAADDAQEYNEEEKVVIKMESENISENTNNLEEVIIKSEPEDLNDEFNLKEDPLLADETYTDILNKGITSNAGHRFLVTKRTQDYTYYACTFKRTLNCPATLKVNRAGAVFPLRGHNNHDAPNNTVRNFRHVLVRRAIDERTLLRTIYDEEAARNTEAAEQYPFPTASSTMHAARRRRIPAIPATLQDLGHLLSDEQWGERYFCTVNGIAGPIYRSTIECPEGVALIFASQGLLDMVVGGVEEIHLDGTFKCIPATPPSYQLLTVHIVVRDKTIPIAYSLMSSGRQALYVRVLQELQVYAPSLQPALILTDYERALRGALSVVFPHAEIVGCFYHYASAVWKMAARLGLVRQLVANPNMKKAIKMLMALPLLPAEQIEEGLEVIIQWCIDHLVDMQPMFDYITRFWIRSVRPQHLSVFGLRGRTNNNVEAFNKVLVTQMGTHPNVFTFIEKLIQMNNRAAVHFVQLERGLRVSRPIANRYLQNDVRVRNAQEALVQGVYTILRFLEVVAHALENIAEDMRGGHIIGLRDHDVINDVAADNEVQQDEPPKRDAILQQDEPLQPVQQLEEPLQHPAES